MTTFRSGPARVRVPATSANLGPGFDSLGLALGMHDELTATVTDAGLSVSVDGEGSDIPADESHLVIRAMRAAFGRLGAQPPGLALSCVNRIPHSRGLGSSAAAIVAGVLLAGALTDGGGFDDGEALELAADIEGHPDNVAACMLGGLTVAWSDAGRAQAVRLDCDPSVRAAVFIPPFEASTAQTRGLLPAQVPHGDAAFAAGRSALLVAALTGRPDALFAATEDRLHQSYRAPAMPQTADLVARLRAAGHAAVVSGAGPTVLVLAPDDAGLDATIALAPDGWRGTRLEIDPGGAQVG